MTAPLEGYPVWLVYQTTHPYVINVMPISQSPSVFLGPLQVKCSVCHTRLLYDACDDGKYGTIKYGPKKVTPSQPKTQYNCQLQIASSQYRFQARHITFPAGFRTLCQEDTPTQTHEHIFYTRKDKKNAVICTIQEPGYENDKTTNLESVGGGIQLIQVLFRRCQPEVTCGQKDKGREQQLLDFTTCVKNYFPARLVSTTARFFLHSAS